MRTHLQSTARYLENKFELKPGDSVLDIASNDGTFLSGYSIGKFDLVGIDPLIEHLNDFYPKQTIKIRDFFSAKEINKNFSKKFKIITSFSVFYDVNHPIQFTKDIEKLLTPDGVWVLEQSYLPSMIQTLGFDTICHEHLLYLTLNDLENITKQAGLKIFNVKLNKVNGGSFQVYVCRSSSTNYETNPYVNWLLNWEIESGITSLESCLEFGRNIKQYRTYLRNLLFNFKKNKFKIFGLGASTKGNVLIQYCGLSEFISEIGEINPKKFGKVTPGTGIPIVNQKNYFDSSELNFSNHLGVILPWHFENSILNSAENYLSKNGNLLLPLPFPTIISR
jgi:2-polyprenyl-3-methyl-5-hydroxy-6-metoxy-1,4-benzoquinol methylase